MAKIHITLLFCGIALGTNAQVLNIKSGAIFSVHGNNPTPVLTVHGSISQEGSLHLAGTVQSAADIALSGTTNVPIGGPSAGTNFDQLLATDAVAITNATLNVSLINGYVPSAGVSFTLIDGGSLSGTFATVNLPALPNGLTWQQLYDGTAGTFILSVTAPLSVELIHFQGKNKGPHNILVWQTASERNNARFVVERSGDGLAFEDIGSVEGFGNTQTVKNYDFTDTKPLQGINYYRLRHEDTDGKAEYSNIILLDNAEARATAKIYPTVVSNFLTVEGAETIEIVDMAGRTVLTYRTLNNEILGLSDLPSGVYIVKGTDNNGVIFLEKIIKQ
jgi:Secretion system C-terminal sorting domain